jgi:DNA-binding transcriptional ArsR family regulator
MPSAGVALFRPLRARILEELAKPGSAAGVARRLESSRQKVSYHLKQLEKDGFVELVEERRQGNCVERIVRATARSYLVSAEAMGTLACDPSQARDRFSSGYLVAALAHALREVAVMRSRAEAAKKKLVTLTMQTDVCFANAKDRAAFAEELATAVASITAKYHDDASENGRSYRVLLGSYPQGGPALEASPMPGPGDSPTRNSRKKGIGDRHGKDEQPGAGTAEKRRPRHE